jgi:hypothetical protein
MSLPRLILILSAVVILIGATLSASQSQPSVDFLRGQCLGQCRGRYTTGILIDGQCWCADPVDG